MLFLYLLFVYLVFFNNFINSYYARVCCILFLFLFSFFSCCISVKSEIAISWVQHNLMDESQCYLLALFNSLIFLNSIIGIINIIINILQLIIIFIILIVISAVVIVALLSLLIT